MKIARLIIGALLLTLALGACQNIAPPPAPPTSPAPGGQATAALQVPPVALTTSTPLPPTPARLTATLPAATPAAGPTGATAAATPDATVAATVGAAQVRPPTSTPRPTSGLPSATGAAARPSASTPVSAAGAGGAAPGQPTRPLPLLPTATPATPAAAAAAVSGPSKIILYVQDQALWAAGFDSSPARQISPDNFYPTPSGAQLVVPANTSPDARWVIGMSTKNNGETWLFSTSGQAQRKLSDGPLVTTWAPNSQGYAWADEKGVYTSGVNEGSGTLTVWQAPAGTTVVPQAIAWTPSGAQIAFLTRQAADGPLTLRVISASGGAPKTLLESKVVEGQFGPDVLQWSPDASAIAWLNAQPPRVVRLKGEPATDLPGADVGYLGFSRDGKRLIAVWGSKDESGIGTTDLQGQDRRAVATDKGGFATAAWSPDGKKVAYIKLPDAGPSEPSQYELWLADADGSNARRIGENAAIAPVTVEWLTPTSLLVASVSGEQKVNLLRADTTSGAIQTLIKDAGWFFATAPQRP
ncbi:MAG: hypothetical protein U0768_17675 [Anaerolineae bacterium]